MYSSVIFHYICHMKHWLTIFFLLSAVVVARAGGEVHPATSSMAAVSAVLTQGGEPSFDPTDTPLFATAISSVTSHMIGSESLSVKSKHPVPANVALMRGNLRSFVCPISRSHRSADNAHRGSLRAVDLYVYALRKIII